MVKRVCVYGLVAGLVGLSAILLVPSDAEAFKKTLVNGKMCRVEGKNPHYHIGVSKRWFATKEAALERAIHKWNRFASWEYGPAFGNFETAEKQSVDCALGVSGHNWACAVKGQPCSEMGVQTRLRR